MLARLGFIRPPDGGSTRERTCRLRNATPGHPINTIRWADKYACNFAAIGVRFRGDGWIRVELILVSALC
jgi:hypothetical protein